MLAPWANVTELAADISTNSPMLVFLWYTILELRTTLIGDACPAIFEPPTLAFLGQAYTEDWLHLTRLSLRGAHSSSRPASILSTRRC